MTIARALRMAPAMLLLMGMVMSGMVFAQNHAGSMTFFDTETGNEGACGGFSKNSDYIVALSSNLWDTGPRSQWCFKPICIRWGDRVVGAEIRDLCPDNGCHEHGLDATPSLFNALTGDLDIGRTRIEWWFTDSLSSCGGARPSPSSSSPSPSSSASPISPSTTATTTSTIVPTSSEVLPTLATTTERMTTTTTTAYASETEVLSAQGVRRPEEWPTTRRKGAPPISQRTHCAVKK
ncbi:hypothetical protein HDU67_009643 [Dinochytrium kinnereticum]|nr:hypothetical protein HDU67_009643 [Dinochytrium kinnereticum]